MSRRVFWNAEKVRERVTEDGDCWLWNLSVSNFGYPRATIDGRCAIVGAWLYHHLNGTAPDGKHIISTRCGNKRCVSPKCLVRLVKKMPVTRQKRDPAKAIRVGRESAISIGWAKLDMEKARAIRASDESAKDLAAQYGVTKDAIYKIRSGINWAEGAANSSVFTWRPAA